MQIETLKVFCDLVETESFTRAAQINRVTQSAVSQQISALERQFKSLLIERSKKRFRLTREGQELYEASKEIVQAYDTLHSRLQELKDVIIGTVRIATVNSLGLHMLPPFLTRYLKQYPNVNVHVAYRRSNQVYQDVLGNVEDLGLVAYPVRHAELETIPLGTEQMSVICHPSHPFAGRKSLKIAALQGQNFIAFEKDIPTRKAVDKVLREHRIAVTTVMEFDNIETVKRAVEVESGIAIVPTVTVAQEVAAQTLVSIKLEDVDLSRPLAAIYKRGRVLSKALTEFLKVLQEG